MTSRLALSDSVMITTLRAPTVKTQLKRLSVKVPGAVALTVRPHPINGQAEALVFCHLGVCPLTFNDNSQKVHLGAPLPLRNHVTTKFSVRRVYDATYDAYTDQVLLAGGANLLGMDADNHLTLLAGDDEGGLIYDGSAEEARFVGAQRLASNGSGIAYIRDRDSVSKNGFCLRALHQVLPSASNASCPPSSQPPRPHPSEAHRAVVTVPTGGDTGPHILTYDTLRGALLFVKRGRAIHRLLGMGVTEEIIGTDEPPVYHSGNAAAAAAASASSSAASMSYDSAGELSDGEAVAVAEDKIFTNIQALAADPVSGNVYILDGTTGSTTSLRVLRPDGCLDTLDGRLRIGPLGSGRWPRLAVLPHGHLAVYGTSCHEILIVKP